MSHSRKAPRYSATSMGAEYPWPRLLATGSVSALAFFSTWSAIRRSIKIFYNASSLTGFIIWLGIAVCHLRFRKAWVAQGRSLDDLKFKSKFYPPTARGSR